MEDSFARGILTLAKVKNYSVSYFLLSEVRTPRKRPWYLQHRRLSFNSTRYGTRMGDGRGVQRIGCSGVQRCAGCRTHLVVMCFTKSLQFAVSLTVCARHWGSLPKPVSRPYPWQKKMILTALWRKPPQYSIYA